ncbi:MAG TPA: FtsQ-type POTRA domain-containing protein [Terriglobia bacterium]|nr:FtsQ-type POTRA domain-containing protein [Terriglobia bacterium]
MSDPKHSDPAGVGEAPAPVYLRLQKRAPAEGRRGSVPPGRFRLRNWALRLIALAGLAAGGWALVRFASSDPRFQLRSLEWHGLQYASRPAVEAVFAADYGGNLYAVPLQQRRQALEQVAWIRSATLTRILPDRLSIRVEERRPVAFLWTRGGVQLVDVEGVILEAPPEASWTFPVLRGVPEREPAERRKKRLARYLRLLEELQTEDQGGPPELSEVNLADPANLTAVVADAGGAVRLHLGDERFAERYAIYRAHIAGWRQRFHEIHSIDLRYEGQAVIQSAAPVTVNVEQQPAASPAPAAPPAQGAVAPASDPAQAAL